MKGIRFYEEFKNKRKGESAGNIFAAFVANGTFISNGFAMQEGIASIFDYPNSSVAGCSASLDFLRQNCKRVGETHAREIHPRLFERLDDAE